MERGNLTTVQHVPEGSWVVVDYFIWGEVFSIRGTSDFEKGIRLEVNPATTSFKCI